MLDYAVLPPEINSGRMYTGPGSGPLLAAAAAWHALFAELESAAAGYAAVLAELTDQAWSGPSAAAMAAAAAPYVAWLQTTAAQAERAAIQAEAAAGAYEAAYALTVPPPVVAANRTLLMTLIATNFFGQNIAAIAATEAHYAEMWAQDATAMYSYAGTSSSTVALDRFSEPPPTTDPAGRGAQAAAATRAAGTAIGSQLAAALPQTSTAATAAPTGVPLFGSTSLFGSTGIFGVEGLLGPTFLGQSGISYGFQALNVGFRANSQVNLGTRIFVWDANVRREGDAQRRFADKYAGSTDGLAAGLGSARPVSAGIGQARPVGALSVPPSWTVDPVAIRPTALALPGSSVTAAAPALPMSTPGSGFSQALMTSLSADPADPVRPKSKPKQVRNPASERSGRIKAVPKRRRDA